MKGEVKPRKTQQEKISDELVKIAPDVSSDDRELVVNKLGVTKSLVSMYLKGNVYSLDTGIKMLKILRECIRKREEIINQ